MKAIMQGIKGLQDDLKRTKNDLQDNLEKSL